MTPPQFCAIVPVYNNALTIFDVVQRCQKVIGDDLIVVSDGSTDGSDEIAAKAGARVLRILPNKGKGYAIRVGLAQAKELGFTHAIVLDADAQHPPEEIPKLIEAVARNPQAIWIGERIMTPGVAPKSSIKGRAISNFWATINGWQRVRDAQSGFRIYPIHPVLALNCDANGFTFEMEVLIRASWKSIPIGHVLVDVVYETENRVSHFDMKRDNWRFTWLSFSMFWGMIVRLPLLTMRRIRRPKLLGRSSLF